MSFIKITFISLLFFFIHCQFVIAQESNVKFNSEGKEFSMLKHTWKAKWITHPFESTIDYGVFMFRRTFKLEKKPEKYIIYISADNRYKLFVNGKYISNGPAKGDLMNYRYETIDIGPYLKNGENCVAAEVVNFGEYKHASQHSFQTAFILQTDSLYKPVINTGDKKWKIAKNHAYNFIPFTSDSLRGYYCAGPCDSIKGEKYPWGWQDISFNDKQWHTPKSATVESAVGRNFLYGSTWFLVPRTIPQLEEKTERFKQIERYKNITLNGDFLKGDGKLTVPPNTKASILIDQTYLSIGYPQLKTSGGNQSTIKITYAESLFKEKNTDKNSEGGHFRAELIKGNRNEVEGKRILGYYDIIKPEGGKEKLYNTLWWRTFRYVQLDIQTKDQELEINDFYSLYSAYPFQQKASFKSDNPFLSQIWDVALRTQRLNSTETFSDCPYYEQLQYIGDTRLQALLTLYMTGDDRLVRKAIKVFDDSRIPEGLTLSRYPSYIKQIIPTYSLFWISMIYDYYMYRNDPEFIQQFEPGIKSVLEWFEKRTDKTGLLGNLQWWNFTDWSKGFQNGVPPGAEYGHSASISLQYVYTLQRAAKLMQAFGNTQLSKKYTSMARNMIKAVNGKCFDATKGMYAETPEKNVFSQHTNILAILTDAISKEKQSDLFDKIITDKELIQVTVYFKFYLFRAMQKLKRADEYTNHLQPWEMMLDNGLTTFAEREYDSRSDCHAWSAYPCFDFLHTICGIYPAEPSFKSIIVEPHLGSLKHIEAVFPHYKGDVIVSLKKKGKNGIKGSITLPKGLNGKFIWNEKVIDLKPGEQNITL